MVLPGGANIATTAGDSLLAYSVGGGNWRVPLYQRADGTSTVFINSLTAETAPSVADSVPIYDATASANRKMTLDNVLKVVNDLPVDSSPVATGDYLLTYDTSAAAAKRALLSAFVSSTSIAGVAEIATAAETLGGFDNARIMTSAGFSANSTAAANGYYKFPGGFTVQWGTDTLVSSGADISFPIPFQSSVTGFVVCPVGSSAPGINNVIVHTIASVAVFRLWAGVSQTVRWMACGF
jgi:hypothetical protein